MASISLMPLDTFTVINRSILDDRDRDILIMLYQPIVGSISINLYMNLWTYLDKIEVISETLEHKKLVLLMGNTLKEIEEAREKLEGVGLIKTYLKEGEINNYVYELYSPVTASEFFSNPLLNTTLYTCVGSLEYKQIKNRFKIPTSNLKDYENISKKFSDVFKSTSLLECDTSNIVKKNFAKVGINSNIDIESLLEDIPDIMLNHTKVSDEVKELILKLSYVYNFNEKNTIDIIKNSINDKHNIDINLLKSNYQNYYEFEHNGTLPSIVYKTQPEKLKKEITGTSSRDKIVFMFENTSPYKFICNKSKCDKPTKSELDILVYLLVDMNLKPGVVNVLIDYVLKINNNKLTKNFISAIASQWKRSNIETVEQAINIAKSEVSKKVTSKVVVKTSKAEDKPVWFDKTIEESVATKEELEKMQDLEKRLRGE